MNKDNIDLLKAINSGCKNATNSIGQALDFIENQELVEILDQYNKDHVDIGDQAHAMLEEAGAEEEDPSAMAKAMTWFTTEMKMKRDSSESKVAELIMDGCHMGMKNITHDCRRYEKADHETFSLAGRLINLEQDLYKRMLGYI